MKILKNLHRLCYALGLVAVVAQAQVPANIEAELKKIGQRTFAQGFGSRRIVRTGVTG